MVFLDRVLQTIAVYNAYMQWTRLNCCVFIYTFIASKATPINKE